jgi:acetyl esterase/lipase
MKLLQILLVSLLALPCFAQTPPAPSAAPAKHDYTIIANIPYDKYPQTVLDIMQPTTHAPGKRPGVVMFHGGGWIESTKETMMSSFCLPYLRQGFVVCNVEYRLAPVATAPAAVNDALDASAWFFRNAAKYGVDPKRIVVTGASAGGHLALMAGMVPASAGLGPASPFAAIVDCYGPTDVADLVAGPHHKSWAEEWLPEQPGRMELAKRLSPLTYVRKRLPPVFIAQGADDHTVPVEQNARLEQALKAVGVPVVRILVPGAKHGFSKEQWVGVHQQIFDFLKAHGIIPETTASYAPPGAAGTAGRGAAP